MMLNHKFLILPRQHYQCEVDVVEVLLHEIVDESSWDFSAGNLKNGGNARGPFP